MKTIKTFSFNNPKGLIFFINNQNQTFAFTLAEVLITLGIIGIVAAMTIPTLLNQTNDKQTVVALKKAYSTFANAYTLAVQENGTPENWNLVDALSEVGATNALNILAPYMKISKNCGITKYGCFTPDNYKDLKSTSTSSYDDLGGPWATAQMVDGSSIGILVRNATCTDSAGSSSKLKSVCGDIAVDINGYKGPNVFGKDYFRFHITKYGIVPKGTLDDNYSFTNDCEANGASGEGCTAWIIYNENMDYTKCTNLDWHTKTKCD